jgi:ribosome biogenesis GTPase / thiamine phosphate phosphatase
MSLSRIGFNSQVARAASGGTDALVRVVEVTRSMWKVHDGIATHEAHPLPALERESPLIVGDWVVSTRDADGVHWLAARIPPYTQLTRIAPSGERQALVANVDLALLVMGLDDNFNLRRLERFIALAKSSHVTPVIVLTKRDLCPDVTVPLDALAARLPNDLERYAVDATDANSLACLAHHLTEGVTAVLLGSSGAGKSTLTNTLLGETTQQTQPVRESDGRGRHTTTARQLHLLPGGACLIDTPGVRGLRLDIAEEQLDDVFDDIGALAASCRFRDCRHEREPGCAVRAAVAPDRLANYHKLRREVARGAATALERERARGRVKSIHRALRAVVKQKRNPQD